MLVASAHTAWPEETPSAVNTPARRPPSSEFRIVSAVSWPGVTITSAETARKAATSWIIARAVSRTGAPLVERVRQPLLVLVLRLPDEPKAVPLVQAPRALVLLEDPQPQPARPLALCELEQRRADAASLCRRVHVQMLEHVALEPREAEHTALLPRTQTSSLPSTIVPKCCRTSSSEWSFGRYVMPARAR